MSDELNSHLIQDLDVKGLLCPEPVMCLHNAIKHIEPGSCLRVTATDPSTARDIPRFCEFLGHALLQQQCEGDVYVYLIKKNLQTKR